MNTVISEEQKAGKLPWAAMSMALNAASAQLTYSGPIFIIFLFQLGIQRSIIGLVLALFHFTNLLGLLVSSALTRRGYKKTYSVSSIGRQLTYLLLIGLLLYAPQTPIIIIPLIVLLIALLRTVSEASFNSWLQQFVPGAYVNRFSIIATVSASMLSAITMFIAAITAGSDVTINHFGVLASIGVALGIFAVLSATGIPRQTSEGSLVRRISLREMLDTLQVRHFTTLLIGTALVNLTLAALTFVPLLLRERLRLTDAEIISVSAVTIVSAMLAGFAWNWAVNRWSSRPVILLSVFCIAILPLAWLALPTDRPSSMPIAVLLAIFAGICNAGWNVGSVRFLLTSIIPTGKSTQFLTVQYFSNGLVSGIGLILVGFSLDYLTASPPNLASLQLNAYPVVLIASALMSLMAVGVIRLIYDGRSMRAHTLAALLMRGNPFRAIRLLIQYRHASAESERMSATANIGASNSMLAVNDLLDALSDPSFSVRHEAISAIPRLPPDERLFNALLDVLRSNEPELSVNAIWALSRLGDKRAIEPLREFLTSQHQLLQANSARALATLGDYDIAPLLTERFCDEKDEGLQLAYGSALGTLRVKDALADMLMFLRKLRGKDPRMEMALAIARLTSNGDDFTRLARDMRNKGMNVVATELGDIRRTQAVAKSAGLSALFDGYLKVQNPNAGAFEALAFNAFLLSIMTANIDATHAMIVEECAKRIADFGIARQEYIVLALHTLHTAFL